MTNGTYSPSEICDIFGISKSTLLRWEKEEWFPRVDREVLGSLGAIRQRIYTEKHIRAICERRKEELGRSLSRAHASQKKEEMRALMKASSISKFLEGEITAVWELAEYPELSEAETKLMLRTILGRFAPHDPFFVATLKAVLKQCQKAEKTDSEDNV